MAVNNNWSQNQSMNDWMRDIEKRLMNEERRPLFQAANAYVGPGIGTYTRLVTDWNSQGPVVNGFFYSYSNQIVNSPDDTKDWIGLVLADPDGHGFQQVWEYVEGVTPGQDVTGSPVTGATSYTRSYITNEDGTRTYSVWSAGSGGGGGIAGIIVEDEGIVVNAAALELNFVGNGVVATGTGNEATITISGIPPDNSVGAPQIIDGSVTTAEIADGTIAVADLNPATVNSLMVDVGEEGTTVVTNANRINFIGTAVLAEPDGLGGANVTISGGSGGSTPGVGTPVGTISLWTGATAPQGWLLCDGSTFKGSTYPELRDLLGDKFGVHTGDDYFLPNYADKYPLGASASHPLNSSASPLMQANQVGSHTHPTANTSSGGEHGHETTSSNADGNSSASFRRTDGTNLVTNFGMISQSGPHAHSFTTPASAAPTAPYYPPYLAQNFIIKAAPGGGTDGTNMLVVADEGTTVASAVTKINYVGAGVVASAGAVGEAVVTVSGVPPANSVTSAMIVDGTIATADMGDAQVTLAKLAPNSVDSSKIVDGSIVGTDLAADTITSTQIAANAVTASELADNAVDNAALAANAVTPDKIADLPATPANAGDPTSKTYVDAQIAAIPPNPTTLPPSGPAGGALSGTYPNPGIATDAVGAAQIAAGAVGNSELAANSVDSSKIVDGTIVDADISATAAIAQSKISGLAASLAAKADLASPVFTGNPTAPTPTAGDNDTSIATTAFVTGAVAASAATKADAARTLTAGAGLTGGGDLTANRTFDVGAGPGITVNADTVQVANLGITNGMLAASAVDSSKIADASIALADLSATGTKDSTTFLRGDNTWAVPPGGGSTGTTRPIGEVTMWYGAIEPAGSGAANRPAATPGWLVLDGNAFNAADYPSLNTLLGGTTLPNFTDRLPIGAGTKALGATGGNPTHTLTIAEMPSHDHTPGTGGQSANHSHNINHAHSVDAVTGAGTGISVYRGSTATPSNVAAVNTFSGDSAGASVGHTHAVTAQGGGAAFDVMNPWRSLWFIIRAA